MVTTVQSYHQAIAELVLEQERRGRPSGAEPKGSAKKHETQPAEPPKMAKDDKIAPKKPLKTFQLFIAHTQPKAKPPLRIQLLRRLYKRRKKLESSAFKTPRIRSSRVWSVV